MRWQPQGAHLTRVIVWRIVPIRGPRKRWTWRASSRNGRPLTVSLERFTSRSLAARAARTFGAPPQIEHHNRVTALHDGKVLALNWSNG